jgi:pimeloyl-ACP methyl ester carboxylesterase
MGRRLAPGSPDPLATELFPVADVDLDQAGELLISQIEQLGAGDPVVVVAHSAGGAMLARAAQLAPRLVAHAVYLTAYMPASGIPALAHARMPENDGSLTRSMLVADPAAVGTLCLDVACSEPAYRQRLREAFTGMLTPAVADAAIALLTMDAPASSSSFVAEQPRQLNRPGLQPWACRQLVQSHRIPDPGNALDGSTSMTESANGSDMLAIAQIRVLCH